MTEEVIDTNEQPPTLVNDENTASLPDDPIDAKNQESRGKNLIMMEGKKSENTFVPVEFAQRHPLQNHWALWYLKGDRNKDWEDCLKQVSIFETVEDFWALYNHIQPASGLPFPSDYYLFKKGIKPMWEDPINLNGGRWMVQIDKQRRSAKLDIYWQELMMAIIGEQFDELGDHICGAVVNLRQKGDKVALWTRDATEVEVNTRIGYILKEKLGIPDSEILRYESHKENSSRTGSTVKSRIVIPAPAVTRDKEQDIGDQQQKRKESRERALSQSK